NSRRILATAALPYANGEVHIGHLLEHIQADVWIRALRMTGAEANLVCADDTHGTPIMIRAREEGITPETLIARSHAEHSADFRDFEVHHSIYSSTNSPENKALCEEFYRELKKNGHIAVRPIEQLYCPHDKMFLPDRFVKGTCPKCGTKEQYGDSCDACGTTYSPSDLKDAHCYLCGTAPITKSSDHYFFTLNAFKDYLREWLPKHTGPETANKMLEWFDEDLRDWDISRDDPYFGFPIPDAPGKYFYVWVDAPMGYVSSTKLWAEANGKKFEDYWRTDEKVEVYHFIGKDIARFHTLFWPAFLKSAGFRTPTQVHVHGFVNVNGEKMSKSKGTMIPVRTYLKHLDPSYLRYYYTSKLNSRVDDQDLNFDDFVQRVNSDLVGKITNLGSRGAQMLKKKMDGLMSEPDSEGLALIEKGRKALIDVQKHFEDREFTKAITEIRTLADEANKYFDEKAPWKTLEADPEGTKKVLTTTLNLFRQLAIGLTPVLPSYSEKVAALLGETRASLPAGESSYHWSHAETILKNRPVADYQHLAVRVDPEKIKAMVEETKAVNEQIQKMREQAKTKKTEAAKMEQKTDDRNAAATNEIEIDDFMKIDLRVGRIIEAEEIPEANKLLRLKVDIGTAEPRQIIAGIKAAYQPQDLIDRHVLVVANLKPRKMKFGMSEGMVLAAGDGGSDLYVLSPDQGAKAGSRVK
ncbi:MAG: methionine--tRNA ligase, partial [Bdellovibrionaceae bacterium]|nr:methionine--tRNA ligase [Pseudobdellovibrionaceae bacterium]